MANVLIVGAGPAGLAVGAVLHQAGISALILEQADRVGSKWHTHYERLHLHTVKDLSELPYMPYPADYPRYPSRLQVIEYLEAYAKRFQLDIRFGQQVISADYDGKQWKVATKDSSYTAPTLVMATGFNDLPNVPTWPGQDYFAGTIVHASDYKNGEPFRGQEVLVIGFGNSGGEIAIDLHEHGAKPSIAVRNPVNVVFRDRFGMAAQRISMLLSHLPPRLADMLTAPTLYMAYGDLPRYGLRKPPYGPAIQIREHRHIPVIDVGTVKLIREGAVKIYPDVREFTEKGVTFVDGTTNPFDAVVLATGYKTRLPALFKDSARLFDSTGYALTSGKETALPHLYFIGMHNAAAGLLREIGIEARQIGQSIGQKINKDKKTS